MTRKGQPTGKFNVAELFAGVGGFRLGLEKSGWSVTWSNQWEPSTKTQHASECYESHFKTGQHVCENISLVAESLARKDKKFTIEDFDLLVGGFPCQDYSVAKSASQAHGIAGKKGVLWWDILKILEIKRPPYLILENVDRLLKSPTSQRGRDFAIILSSLSGLGYAVEWRVINAAEYGFPQKRRRVFIVGIHKSQLKKLDFCTKEWITDTGILAQVLPVSRSKSLNDSEFTLDTDLLVLSETFGTGLKSSPFLNSGIMRNGKVISSNVTPRFRGKFMHLEDVLQPDREVIADYFIDSSQITSWKYLKGAKREEREHKDSGAKYFYTEGAIPFPDRTDSPARTILTGEGGSTASRFKHVIEAEDGRFRRLTPIELERLNGFPDNWTQGMPDGRRAFMMGNALVVGIVEKIGKSLYRFAKGD